MNFDFNLQLFAASPSSKNLLLGAGKVFFDRWDSDGNSTGLRHIGNVDKYDVNEEATVIEKKQSMYAAKTTYLQVISEIKATADITLTEFTPENIAMAFLGEEGTLIQTADPVKDEVHTVSPGQILKLDDGYFASDVVIKPSSAVAASIAAATSYGTVTSTGTVTSSGTYTGTKDTDYYIRITAAPTDAGTITGCKIAWKAGLSGTYSADISAGATAAILENGLSVLLAVTGTQTFTVGDMYKITARAAITTYVSGTDYKTETSMLRAGLVTIPSTSGIPAGSDVLVSYNKPAGVYPKISMASASSVEGYMIFAGDPSKGPAYNADMWHVSITPNGAMGFISDEVGTFAVKVSIMDDRENHPDEPLYRLLKLN
jgi:hypothetical protein